MIKGLGGGPAGIIRDMVNSDELCRYNRHSDSLSFGFAPIASVAAIFQLPSLLVETFFWVNGRLFCLQPGSNGQLITPSVMIGIMCFGYPLPVLD